ncbi:NlpC/P60 family protein [Streptosporangium sp. NPDC023615]|uniref:NlpC/P60 family protein n=1 Tax=Streptosporangium sp. NPDC023615 TaxID=3154794 RepID=UPI00344615D9
MRIPLRRLRHFLATTGTALVLVSSALTAGVAPAQAAAGGDTLYGASNETLHGAQNQALFSPGGIYEARMQSDGNFVVYGPNGPIWSSNTRGSNPRLVMQSDGNLVIYADSGVIFSTNTSGRGGTRLQLQTDGNLVMYGGGPVWASKDAGERAIQWFHDNLGRTDLDGWCEKAVETAFGYVSPHYNRAVDNWNARSKQQPYTAAPRGALVFYNTSSAGHVAVSLGNGRIVSTSTGGGIGIVSVSYFQAPLGWARAPW